MIPSSEFGVGRSGFFFRDRRVGTCQRNKGTHQQNNGFHVSSPVTSCDESEQRK
jgi:hypothetical protein